MADLSVNYAHCWQEMYKGIDSNGPFYDVKYYIKDWSLADSVANQLRGYTTRIGTTTMRYPPHQHPLSPNLQCIDVKIEGVGTATLNASGLPYYSDGFIASCRYQAIPWMPGAVNDPGNLNQIDPTNPILWCTQELDFATEEYVHESNQYVWETGDSLNGTKTGIPIRVTLGVTTMNITFHQLPYMPLATLRSLRNKINSTTFLGASAYTILFVGGRSVRDFSADGTICQKVSLTFKERDVDWRMFLRKDKIDWAKVKDSSGNYVLSTADLTPLIQL